ncbi:MAG: sensor histidine kinase [Planctomycetota bacterium]
MTLFAVVAGVFALAWSASQRHERSLLHYKLMLAAEQVSRGLQSALGIRLAQLRYLEEPQHGSHLSSQAEFNEHVETMRGTFAGIHAIRLFDGDGAPVWPSPSEESARVGAADPRPPDAAETIRAAVRERMAHATRTYRAGGERRVAAYLPVARDDELHGVLGIEIALDPILRTLASETLLDRFHVELRERGQVILEDQWAGAAMLATLAEERPVEFVNRSWSVWVAPTSSTVGATYSLVDEVLLIVGILLGAGLAVLAWGLLKAQNDLAENQERLAAAAEHIPGVVYSYDWDPHEGQRRVVYLGPGLAELLGPRQAGLVEQRFDALFDMIHPDDRASVLRAAGRIRPGETLDREIRIRADDGEFRWVRSLARLVPRAGGGSRWHVVLIDVQEQKRIAERQRLLLRELDHRVKNNLAAVQSLCDQTLASTDSREGFRRAFVGRITALARTHTLLATDRSDPVDLWQLVGGTLEPYISADTERISVDGIPLRVPTRVASPLGLVLHELATNAVKHGALSTSEGSLHVGWGVEGGRLRLWWREHAGRAVDTAPTEGLGLRLVRGLIEHELSGCADFEFAATGLRCDVSFPFVAAASGPVRDDAERTEPAVA